jgi:hypothetical protein
MPFHFHRRLDIGQQRISMEEPHQLGALSPLIGNRPLPHNGLSLLHKIGGKIGTINWRGTWHNVHLFAFKGLVFRTKPS